MDAASAHSGSSQNHGIFAGRWFDGGGEPIVSIDPSNGETLGRVTGAAPPDYDEVVRVAAEAFASWRLVPGAR